MNQSEITIPQASSPPIAARERRFVWLMPAAVIFFFAALWFILCRHLSGEWSVNEQYSYGWFVPFFALFLFWLRWEDKPRSGEVGSRKAKVESEGRTEQTSEVSNQYPELELPHSAIRSPQFPRLLLSTFYLLLLAALLPLRLFEVGNPDWRPLGWVHAGIVVALTLGAIGLIGGWRWVRHFAFPVSFILIAVPWVSPIETPIVQGLMRIVAVVATETLHLFGIPAQLEGSLIRISTGLVGVNEACSGVRSLQTSLMIGLLFGELKRLSIARRFALVAGALAIALLCNFARAFTLVWLSATRGPGAAESWHDGLGYAIVGLVFAGSMGLAEALGRSSTKVKSEKAKVEWSRGAASDMDRASRVSERERAHQSIGTEPQEPAAKTPQSAFRIPQSNFLLSPSYFLLPLIWIVAIEISVEAWYRLHERNLIARDKWTVRYPEGAPGFRQIDIDEDVQSTLRYDEGRQVAWSEGPFTNNNSPLTNNQKVGTNFSLFFFRWEPGTATILRARSHRPDVCLPNVGWRQTGDFGVRDFPISQNASLPFRHFAFVREIPGQRSAYAHSFFCMQEDKIRPQGEGNDNFDLNQDSGTSGWGRSDRLRVVLEGMRNPGQQVMQFVMISPGEVTETEAKAQFARQLPELVVVEGSHL